MSSFADFYLILTLRLTGALTHVWFFYLLHSEDAEFHSLQTWCNTFLFFTSKFVKNRSDCPSFASKIALFSVFPLQNSLNKEYLVQGDRF